MRRREFFSFAFSGLAAFATACGPAGDAGVRVIDAPEGRVLQWEKDELMVLVSGAETHYRPGQTIRLQIVVNNQAMQPVQTRIRTKLLGRGNQAVAEAPVESVAVDSLGAATLERELTIPDSIRPGDYSLLIEVPPWLLAQTGRTTGGGNFSQPLVVEA